MDFQAYREIAWNGIWKQNTGAEKGEFSTAVDNQGNIYVADGNIYVFNSEGKQIDYIEIPERPMTITFGGKDGNTLFVTSAEKLFKVKLQ